MALVPQQIGRSVALLLIKMPRRWYFRVAPCQSIIFHWPPSSFPEPTTPQGNICQLSHQEFVQFVPELAISSNISPPIWAFLFIKKLIVNKISGTKIQFFKLSRLSAWVSLLHRDWSNNFRLYFFLKNIALEARCSIRGKESCHFLQAAGSQIIEKDNCQGSR